MHSPSCVPPHLWHQMSDLPLWSLVRDKLSLSLFLSLSLPPLQRKQQGRQHSKKPSLPPNLSPNKLWLSLSPNKLSLSLSLSLSHTGVLDSEDLSLFSIFLSVLSIKHLSFSLSLSLSLACSLARSLRLLRSCPYPSPDFTWCRSCLNACVCVCGIERERETM